MKKDKIITKFIISLFFMICILPLIIISLFMFVDKWVYPNIFPSTYTLKYLLSVIQSKELPKAMITSIIVAVMSAVISVIISYPTGKALAHYNFKGKHVISILILIPLIVSPLVLVSSSHINLIKYNLHSTLLGVSLIHTIFILPYTIRIFNDRFEEIGVEYELQGYTLGGNVISTFFLVTLPLLRVSVMLSFSLGVIISLGQYLTTLIIGGGRVMTISIILVPYIQYSEYQLASIYSFILIALTIISYTLIAKLYKNHLEF